MHRLFELAQQRWANRERRRAQGDCSEDDDDDDEEEDDADAAARSRRRKAGGLINILAGRRTDTPARSHTRDEASSTTQGPQEVTEDVEPVPPRRAWREWRPWIANVERAPPAGRRFSVSDEDCRRLSPEQLQAARILEAGASCFVTGPGGTGKTELIRTIHSAATHAGLRVQITASTGIAARNIQGVTLHRLAGLGLMQDWTPQQLEAALRQWGPDDHRRRNWAAIDLLVVDEVSMLSVDFILKVDTIARHCRDDRVPFGGIQLLLLGDFAQLTTGEDGGAVATHAFDHPRWPDVVPYTVLLSTCFRQKDARFRDMLNRLRLGTYTRSDLAILEALSIAAQPPSTHAPPATPVPELSAFRAIAADINRNHIRALVETHAREAVAYTPNPAAQGGHPRRDAGREGGQDAATPEAVPLCVGARVLLTRNMEDTRLVNGSLGTLVRFEDAAVGPGQPYPRLPVVQWDPIHGTEGFTTTVMPVVAYGEEDPAAGSEPLVTMPLICAWGLTVHRAQGMTLNAAVVHAATMRTPALLYTALSRVRELGGLQIRGHVRPENIVAHPRVVHYYNCLADMIGTEGVEAAGAAQDEGHGQPLAIVPTRLLAQVVAETA